MSNLDVPLPVYDCHYLFNNIVCKEKIKQSTKKYTIKSLRELSIENQFVYSMDSH